MRAWTGRSGKGGALVTAGPLAVLAAFSVLAVAGYAVFGRDPSRLGGLSAGAARFYAISFSFFAQGQVLLAALVLAVELVRRTGWRWLGALGLVYGISLGSELVGTAYGFPFGAYAYTGLLGPKWLGLVPVLIPLSWWFMAVPSYGLAARVVSSRGGGSRAGFYVGDGGSAATRIFLGSLLLLAWDLVLDPAMSEATPYWVWAEPGPYYGMPLQNLFGWYVTGVALMAGLEWLRAREWVVEMRPGWLAAFYAVNLALPVGMAVAAGMVGAAVATALLLGGVVVGASLRSRSHSAGEVEVAG